MSSAGRDRQSDSAGDLKNPLAILDMDTALISSDGKPNLNLIETLKKFGIKDVCLFTSLFSEKMLQQDDVNKKKYAQVEELLLHNGITVHAVVTPLGLEAKALGSIWKEKHKPQAVNKIAERYQERFEEGMTALDQKCHGILMELVNDGIKGNINKGTIDTLKNHIVDAQKEIIHLMNGKNKNEKAIIRQFITDDQLNHINSLSSFCEKMKEDCSNIKEILPSPDEIFTKQRSRVDFTRDPNPMPKVRDYVMQMYKGDMYAEAITSPMLSEFDGYIVFDTSDVCLKSVRDRHLTLQAAPLLHCISVDPHFINREEYYEKEIGKVMPAKELALITLKAEAENKKKLEELELLIAATSKELQSLAEEQIGLLKKLISFGAAVSKIPKLNFLNSVVNTFAAILNKFVYYDKETRVLLGIQKKCLLEKLNDYAGSVPEEQAIKVLKKYKQSPIVKKHTNYGLWALGKTITEKKIDQVIAAELKRPKK